MSGYYAELARASDAARRAGWRHRLEQAARFELVRALARPGDALLDLGCGTGALRDYLRLASVDVTYRGVEQAPHLVAEARATCGADAIVVADALEADLAGADLVVAVGVMVDGRPLRDDGARFALARRWLARVAALSGRVGTLLVLDQDALDGRPGLRAEPALGGVRRAEVPWLAEAIGAPIRVADVLSTDLALIVGAGAADAHVPDVDAQIAGALGHPWAASASDAERAWLAAQ